MGFEKDDNGFTGLSDAPLVMSHARHHATGEEGSPISGPRDCVVLLDAVLEPDFAASFDDTGPECLPVMRAPVAHVRFGIKGGIWWW